MGTSVNLVVTKLGLAKTKIRRYRHIVFGSFLSGNRGYLNSGRPTIIAPKLTWPSGRPNASAIGGHEFTAALKYPAQQAPKPKMTFLIILKNLII
jgi:hypothetical protein